MGLKFFEPLKNNMRIEDVLKLLADYEDAVKYTDHRELQLSSGWVTVRVKGAEDVYYGVHESGGVAKMPICGDAEAEMDVSHKAWEKLKGFELERYMPFRIVSIGCFASGTGNRRKAEALGRQVKEAVVAASKAAKAAAAEEGRPRKVFPLMSGGRGLITYFSSNGMQVTLYSGRDYERYNEARRFFKKSCLPYSDSDNRKKYAYCVVSAKEEDVRRWGESLKEETAKTLSELTAFAGTIELTELIGPESEEKHYL